MANASSSAASNAPAPAVSPRSAGLHTAGSGERESVGQGQGEGPETARLRAQYAEISQLAGGLAHEIRNPLSTVQLNLDLLAEDFEDGDAPRDRRARERIDRLRHEVRRLHGILENFLRFARVQDLRLEPVDLNTVVEELRDFYGPRAMGQSIVVRTQLASEPPRARLDVDLFKQALLNLVLNAEHAMPSGGELILTTRRAGGWIVLEVTDTGVGMAEDVRARIFDPFYSTRSAGSGLGLPTARKIVEAHGGTIQVQSEPGKGSLFTIQLPSTGDGNGGGPAGLAAEAAEDRPAPAAPAQPAPRGRAGKPPGG